MVRCRRRTPVVLELFGASVLTEGVRGQRSHQRECVAALGLRGTLTEQCGECGRAGRRSQRERRRELLKRVRFRADARRVHARGLRQTAALVLGLVPELLQGVLRRRQRPRVRVLEVVQRWQGEVLADRVADVCRDEVVDPLLAPVPLAEELRRSARVGGVYLRVGVAVVDALNVDNDELLLGKLVREVAERLRRVALVLRDVPGVVVVLNELSLDVLLDGVRFVVLGHLDDKRVQEVDRFGRSGFVVLHGVALGELLQLHVEEVGVAD